MNNQKLLDKVAKHLLKQKTRAGVFTAGVWTCEYLAKDGKRCAVGCLIQNYDSDCEGKPVRVLGHDFLEKAGIVLEEPTGFALLKQLQYLHDQTDPCDWKYNLMELAHYYNLGINF